ncbi:hypothetical protein Cadr_000012533 [Camelus dromedarius]|uniref:Uncharacterized protein n=1 Tax=Camelus dromedarius TaxID=9838 RepID=A0A5N4D9Q4_CAMDR|nr:hypothetical protein Cadr_000012533 [Camelus dromedarius]
MACCQYNPAFQQVVSCSEESVVKVWDFETGRLLSEFTGACGSAGITCLPFDPVEEAFRYCQRHVENHRNKEAVLCVAYCPPFLLATSHDDGESIIWNVISGHRYCKLNTSSPPEGAEDGEGLRHLLEAVREACPIANFTTLKFGRGLSRDKARISSMAVTAGDTCDYVADQDGLVHVCDIEEYGLPGPELQPSKGRQ